ncbi:hypothetical protein DKX38_003001 [Salix brachista]|uniref:Uncharacterized protein n=1 Tax=Salix brachista TaxID=2182728 RepID=A0A5N5NQH5_9ROSI|nr:hypothetical protein DKX38_003001 [Salix brachista]
MQTQHKIEMDKRDGKFGPQPAMAVPPVQHVLISQFLCMPAAMHLTKHMGSLMAIPHPHKLKVTLPPAGYPQPHAYPPPGYSR